MFEKKYTVKQFISVAVGVPAAVVAVTSINSEELWLMAISAGLLWSVLLWNVGLGGIKEMFTWE